MPEITFAIGDIHGRHDLLQILLREIDGYAAGQPYKLVFLGDLIDRGPDSAAVVQTVRGLQARSPERVICLKGNHEAMMVGAVDASSQSSTVGLWLMNGGQEALRSFGVQFVRDTPPDVVEWARQLPSFYEDERRYYVHAGLDPRRSRDDQDDETRLWIRGPFLNAKHDFGKHIVHGHTPLRTGRPDERTFRTNLDTGAAYGGALTAGVFTSEQQRAGAYLQVPAQRRSD